MSADVAVFPAASAGGERVLEEPQEPFGALGGLTMEPGIDGSGDHLELRRHVGAEAVAPPDQPIQPLRGRVEAREGSRRALGAGPLEAPRAVRVEGDDVAHAATLPGATDTPRSGSQATRTLVTGARRPAAVPHVRPPSAEPNTSPLVAPKYRLRSSPSPSASNAWRRIVR